VDASIPKTRWAKTVDGLCIAYQDFGAGPDTLIVIHGWVSHVEVYWEWRPFARLMHRLSRSMRVLHFDKRGTGLSDKVSGPLDIGVRMDDVRAVMDAAGVERAALYGWGWGAPPLAVLFAATFPERTFALLLDGPLAIRWAPDYSWGISPQDFVDYLSRLMSSWGEDEHALEIGQLTCGDRPEDGAWDDAEFVRLHAKLARYAATPGSFEAFERDEFETDARDTRHRR